MSSLRVKPVRGNVQREYRMAAQSTVGVKGVGGKKCSFNRVDQVAYCSTAVKKKKLKTK